MYLKIRFKVVDLLVFGFSVHKVVQSSLFPNSRTFLSLWNKKVLYTLAVTLQSSLSPAPGNHESTPVTMDLSILDIS